MKNYKCLTLLVLSLYLVKGVVAQSYPNLALENMTNLVAPFTYEDPFYSNPQAGAWKIASGSPGVVTDPSVLVPSITKAIQIGAGTNLEVCWNCNNPAIDINGDGWCPISPGSLGRESIYYEADFLEDHKYDLSISYTTLGSPDKFYIILANNLPEVSNPTTSPDNLCSAPIPTRSFAPIPITEDMQIIHEVGGNKPWSTWHFSFIPEKDYTQLWFVVADISYDPETSNLGTIPPQALFSINSLPTGKPGLTCCPDDVETITATEHRMEGLYGTSPSQLSWVSYYVHRSLRPYISAYNNIDIEAGAPFGITIKNYDPPVAITAGGTISITATSTYSFTVEPPTQVGEVKLDLQAGVDCDCAGSVNSICDNLIGGEINYVSEAQFLDNSTVVETDPDGIPYLEWQNPGNRCVIIQDYLVRDHENPFIGKWIPKTVGYTFPIPGFNYPKEFNATKIAMLMTDPQTSLHPYQFDAVEFDCGIPIEGIPWYDGANVTLPAFLQTQIDLENCYNGDNFFGNGLVIVPDNNFQDIPSSSLTENLDMSNLLTSDLEKEKVEKLSDSEVASPINRNNMFFPDVIVSKEDVLGLFLYPNPTKDFIKINYELVEDSEVSIKILNSLSKVISEIDKGKKQILGKYSRHYNTSRLTPGIYFCEIKTQNKTITKRFIKQ